VKTLVSLYEYLYFVMIIRNKKSIIVMIIKTKKIVFDLRLFYIFPK